MSISNRKDNSRIDFAFFLLGLTALLAGCDSMDHGSTANPSSTPIAPLTADALFIVNGGGNSVTVLNTATNEVAGTIALKDAAYPHHIHVSPDGLTLALAIPGMDMSAGHEGGGHAGHGMVGSVLLMDASTGKTKAARRLDGPNHNAAYSPDGQEIWTSQMTSPGKIIILDAATLDTKQSIEVGRMTAEITFSLDGKYAFAANGMSNDVTVLDASTKALVKTITVGDNPVGAWPGTDGMMYVDNETAKSITIFHGTTLELAESFSLGFMPGMAATTPDGELWITDAENGKVVFFAAGDTVKSGEAATGAGAHAIQFSGDGLTGYVSNQGAGTVSVIDVATHAVTKTITVGAKPNGMAFLKLAGGHPGH